MTDHLHQPATGPTARPSGDEAVSGAPVLEIRPATSVQEPLSFTTARGDQTGAEAEWLRKAVADVRLEVFVGEQSVPFIQEMDARDDESTTIHLLAGGADGTPLGAGRILLEPENPARVHLGRLAVRSIARVGGSEPVWSRPLSRPH
ncbi:hypothetical protein [Actinomyces naeslundii]|uniref:hypothetical protein n=1 Tax=Actinomyces naeslundii TaxID=1655 RepID=UPI002092261A|nr:hypothetical protein [Actinomyces naeslundii]